MGEAILKWNIIDSILPTDQLKDILDLIDKIDYNIKNEICLDMSEISWVTPFSALIISNKISQLYKSNNMIRIIPPKYANVASYLTNLGFPLGKKYTSQLSYCPIYHFSKDVQHATTYIFEVIDNTFPETLKGNSLKYVIGELSDNIEQHSKYKNATIMVQHYKSKGYIDIGIMDDGISIPGNFEKNNIKFDGDADSINKALEGVSTKKEEGRGEGLPSSNRLVEKGFKGEFYLFSRRGGLVSSYQKERKLYKFENYIVSGTICYIRFEAPKKEIDVYKYLKDEKN